MNIVLPQRTRYPAIDIIRAVTMFLMIFVNDVSGVQDIPAWIEHTEAARDGMGFADTIFPAFLFIVGLSLPLAIGSRLQRKEPLARIFLYVCTRSAALIIMGFFHVNGENYSEAALIPRDVWTIIITVAFFLIWLDYPPRLLKVIRYSLITAGILTLLWMTYFFKGGSVENPEPMQAHWWGILGIIGWAYLICALLFLVLKGKQISLLIVLTLFIAINICEHAGWLQAGIPLLGDASSATLVMAGAITTIFYRRQVRIRAYGKVWLFISLAGITAIVAGFIVRPFAGGISKIYATPAWVFICTGITLLVFEVIIWLIDIRHQQKIFKWIMPAGTSTLTCYLLPYLLYSIYSLVHFEYPSMLNHGAGGIIRSFGVSFIIILVAGFLEKKRIRLKI